MSYKFARCRGNVVDYQGQAKQLIDAYNQYGSRDAAAKALGISPYVFSMRAAACRKAGFDVPRLCPEPICTKEEFRALWDQGLTKQEIAQRLEVPLDKVNNFVINHGNSLGLDRKSRRKVPVPRVNKVQAFLDVWQTCNSVAEVAQRTGRSIDCASSLATRGRKLGYPFKYMPGIHPAKYRKKESK